MNKTESKYFKTALKMDHALISLLKQKTLEYITVKEICRVAGVNRSTFYLHYETVADLLEETTRYLLDSFLSYFGEDLKKSVAKGLRECSLRELNFICDEYLLPFLSYIRDHKEVFGTALRYPQTFGFDDVYKRMFQHIFDPILGRFQYPESDRQYVMLYYVNGIRAIQEKWLSEGCERPVEEMARVIKACVFGRGNILCPVVEA